MARLEMQQPQGEMELLRGRIQLLDGQRALTSLHCQTFEDIMEKALSAPVDNTPDLDSSADDDSPDSDCPSPVLPGPSPHTKPSRPSLDMPAHHSRHVSSSCSRGRRLPLGESSQQLPTHQRHVSAHVSSWGEHQPWEAKTAGHHNLGSQTRTHHGCVSSPGVSARMPRSRVHPSHWHSTRSHRVSFDIDSEALTYYGWSPTSPGHEASMTSRLLSTEEHRLAMRDNSRTSLELPHGASPWAEEDSSTSGRHSPRSLKSNTASRRAISRSSSSSGDGYTRQAWSPHQLRSSLSGSSHRSPLATVRGASPAQEQYTMSFNRATSTCSRVTLESVLSEETDREGSLDSMEGSVHRQAPLCSGALTSDWLAESPIGTSMPLGQHRHPCGTSAMPTTVMSAVHAAAAVEFQSTDIEDVETSEASDEGEFLQNVDRSRQLWARRASLDLRMSGRNDELTCAAGRGSAGKPVMSDSSEDDISTLSALAVKHRVEGRTRGAGAKCVARQVKSTLSMARKAGLSRLWNRPVPEVV